MGCGRSRPSCCRAPRKRRREPDEPPRPDTQELGPLRGDTAAAPPPAPAEPRPAPASTPRPGEEDTRRWEQQVERDPQLEWSERLRARLAEQRTALGAEHELALQALRAAHQRETEALTRSFREEEAALQDAVAGLTSQLEAFQAKARRAEESVLSRDYRKHCQDHGGLSPFWERELESLHFVIEMRSERVRALDRQLARMEAVKERNLLLEEKLAALQQESEDLRARGRGQAAAARQLSEDLQAAREALDEARRGAQQLQQEKEELLFRVLGAQAAPAFPLAASAPAEVSLAT